MKEYKRKIISNPKLYLILKPPAVLLFKVLFRPRITGANNIPKKGGIVLAGNHKTSWDCFMVMAGTKRCVHFLAKSELFGNFFTKWFFGSAGLIPVNRNKKDRTALKNAKAYLEKGCVVGIFPEGGVNKTKSTLLPFKIGAVKMAKDTGKAIVPFTINGKYIPFAGTVEIIFQKPFCVLSDDLTEENERLKKQISLNLKHKVK